MLIYYFDIQNSMRLFGSFDKVHSAGQWGYDALPVSSFMPFSPASFLSYSSLVDW